MRLTLQRIWVFMVFLFTYLSVATKTDGTAAADGNDFIQKVHIVFMNHLDVGYASFIANIINEYFTVYIPRAISLAYGLKRDGYVETFIYTTHPWLVSLYVDCPPNFTLNNITVKCPNATQKSQFEAAVKAGYITWHAGPMNLQIEMADDWLFGAGIDISVDLDKKFNIRRPLRVLSQRDVPGMTCGAIPVLVKKGVSAVSVGVNNMTPPPAVPPLFVWKKGSDSVMATWHPGGYPDNPGPNPANPGGISRHDCVVLQGFPEALCFAFRTDNSGPPESLQEILSNYEILRAEFPNALLTASTFEAYFSAVSKVRGKLPVVEGEIGDTWIQGVASDPRKCAEYRAVSRVIRKCVTSGKCLESDARLKNARRFLIKLPEHTWGYWTENDNQHWNNTEFHSLRKKSAGFVSCARSWLEQREFVRLTVQALSGHPVVPDIQRELNNLAPKQPVLSDFVPVKDRQRIFQCPRGNIKSLRFGSDGSIISLNYNGIDWVDSERRLSSFLYRTHSEEEYGELCKVYRYRGSCAFNKTGMGSVHPESKLWSFNMTALYSHKVLECDFYASISAADAGVVQNYGAPRTVWLRYTVRSNITGQDAAAPGVDVTLLWFDKTPTRLVESLSLIFKVKPQKSSKWQLWKLNQPIDPLSVLLNGSHYQHVVDDNGAEYAGPGGCLRITSPDVPLALPIVTGDVPHVFPLPLKPISKPLDGIAFNMYNNIWSTNYVMWYPYADGDENFRARFSIVFSRNGLPE